MIILFIARTGRGKDTCARYLTEKYGLKQLKSYSTRPKRGKEDTHIFINKKDVDKYKEDMIAYTKIGEYEYFATKEQIKNADIYIVDPIGYLMLKESLPEETFFVIYITLNRNEARKRAILRNPENKSEGDIFDLREADEDKQFSDFEKNQYADVILDNRDWSITKKNLDSIYKAYSFVNKKHLVN